MAILLVKKKKMVKFEHKRGGNLKLKCENAHALYYHIRNCTPAVLFAIRVLIT